MPTIMMRDVIKVYRSGKSEVIALRGLDLDLLDGELVAVQGPSGCGKSTLLNLIGGLDRPTAGRIEVGGTNIVDFSEVDLVRFRRMGVGFVFQFFNLMPTLTAAENIELPMRLAGKPSQERVSRAKELLRLIGLEKRGNHRPDELSGGEQQRIAVAVALANDAPLILADEPTGELDTEMGRQVLDLFRRMNEEQKKTILIVTHDPRVANIAHRLLQMEDGKILTEIFRHGKRFSSRSTQNGSSSGPAESP